MYSRCQKSCPGFDSLILEKNMVCIFSLNLHLPLSHDLKGPIVSFNAAGHPVIVLNSHKSAYELLGKIQMIKS